MKGQTGSITLRGWKGFDVEDVPLWPVTMLIGPNGCGKRSLLEALALVAHLGRRGSLREDLRPWLRGWPDRVFTRRGPAGAVDEAETAMSWGKASYRLRLRDAERPRIAHETLTVGKDACIKEGKGGARVYTGATVGRPLEARDNAESALGLILRASGKRRAPQHLVDLLTRIEVYALDADFLRGTAVDTRPTPYHRKGTSLVAGLLDAHDNTTAWKRILDGLHAVQPDLEGMEVVPRPRAVLLRYADGRETQLDEESDGLVRAAGMFLVRYRAECPAILGFDEPENGLHMSRLVDVVSRLAPDRGRRATNPRIVLLADPQPGAGARGLTKPQRTDGRPHSLARLGRPSGHPRLVGRRARDGRRRLGDAPGRGLPRPMRRPGERLTRHAPACRPLILGLCENDLDRDREFLRELVARVVDIRLAPMARGPLGPKGARLLKREHDALTRQGFKVRAFLVHADADASLPRRQAEAQRWYVEHGLDRLPPSSGPRRRPAWSSGSAPRSG